MGPPKEVSPSLRNTLNTVRADSGAALPVRGNASESPTPGPLVPSCSSAGPVQRGRPLPHDDMIAGETLPRARAVPLRVGALRQTFPTAPDRKCAATGGL